MIDSVPPFNSNQRLLRSQRKSANSPLQTFNAPADASSRFMTDTQEMNLLPPSTYSLIHQDLTNYSSDAFLYSPLSDFSYRTEHYHTTRMSPYARQTLYPLYTQREIHSPSSSTYHG
jgi:hypothetical protein